MVESAGLAFDDPHSDSDTTIMGADSLVPPLSPHDESGDSPPTGLRGSAPHSLGSPMEAGEMLQLVPAVTTLASGADTVGVHVLQSELDNLHLKHIILFVNVTSFNNAMISHDVMALQCIGHMTIYYKRATNTLVKAVRLQLSHPRPLCGWCLTCVGRDAPSASQGRSLLLQQ